MRYILFFFCVCCSFVSAENITVIGIGRLGLSFALCLERAGYYVIGVDVSEDYITQINNKTLSSSEPMVNEYLQESRNFKATTSLKEGLAFSDIYFIMVPTNSIPGMKSYDHTILSNVLKEMNSYTLSNKHIVITSTIFPGYTSEWAREIIKDCPNTTVSYNPEFIAQGNIIYGIENPDVVLIGEGSARTGDRLESIHQSICISSPYVARMTVESAEIAKLALNCFITAKIAFANLIGDIADETPGANKEEILAAIGQDPRIGSKCLLPGYGFGGPCFPRDNRALGNYASLLGVEPLLFISTDRTNNKHAEYMAKKLIEKNLNEYFFEDVTYKPHCPVPIIEESQKLEVAKKLSEAGKKVVIKDSTQVIKLVKEKYGNAFEYTDQHN